MRLALRLQVPVSWLLDLSPAQFEVVVAQVEEDDRRERIEQQRAKMRARLGR